MKKMLIFFMALILVVSFAYAKPAPCDNSGSIWTTNSNGDIQDQNLYLMGDSVYLKGQNLMPSVTFGYDIIDVGAGNPTVFSGTVTTDSDGDIDVPQFVFDTTGADSGEYKIELLCYDGSKLKSDNFKVGENNVPEFGVVGGIVAVIGALGLFVFMRKN